MSYVAQLCIVSAIFLISWFNTVCKLLELFFSFFILFVWILWAQKVWGTARMCRHLGSYSRCKSIDFMMKAVKIAL